MAWVHKDKYIITVERWEEEGVRDDTHRQWGDRTHHTLNCRREWGGRWLQDDIMLAQTYTCRLAQKHFKDSCQTTLHITHPIYSLNNSNAGLSSCHPTHTDTPTLTWAIVIGTTGARKEGRVRKQKNMPSLQYNTMYFCKMHARKHHHCATDISGHVVKMFVIAQYYTQTHKSVDNIQTLRSTCMLRA